MFCSRVKCSCLPVIHQTTSDFCSSWFENQKKMTVGRIWQGFFLFHIFYLLWLLLFSFVPVLSSQHHVSHTGSCQTTAVSLKCACVCVCMCMYWCVRRPRRGHSFFISFHRAALTFLFLPVKWILRGHWHTLFSDVLLLRKQQYDKGALLINLIHLIVICLLVDFPGVGSRVHRRIRGNKSQRQWNNEVTSLKKALYYSYIIQCVMYSMF